MKRVGEDPLGRKEIAVMTEHKVSKVRMQVSVKTLSTFFILLSSIWETERATNIVSSTM